MKFTNMLAPTYRVSDEVSVTTFLAAESSFSDESLFLPWELPGWLGASDGFIIRLSIGTSAGVASKLGPVSIAV